MARTSQIPQTTTWRSTQWDIINLRGRRVWWSRVGLRDYLGNWPAESRSASGQQQQRKTASSEWSRTYSQYRANPLYPINHFFVLTDVCHLPNVSLREYPLSKRVPLSPAAYITQDIQMAGQILLRRDIKLGTKWIPHISRGSKSVSKLATESSQARVVLIYVCLFCSLGSGKSLPINRRYVSWNCDVVMSQTC